MKIRINMLSKATSVPGQGVGSAYQEQIKLVNSLDDIDMAINSKDSNFDIYHIHSPNPSLKMKMNKKHINVMHVHFVPQHNEGSLRLIWPCNVIFKQYAKSLYRKADELVVVNPTFTKYIEELGISRDRVTYIPNYVDPEAFHPLAKAEIEQLKDQYGIPHDKFIVLGCGQIQVRKGFDDFVEVAKKSPDKFFLWVGGFSFGFLTDGYHRYKKMMKHLPENMKVIGIFDRSKMNDMHNISDVLFMPSFIELFPMSILEACNANRPILLRDLDLYKPILFEKYCRANDVDGFISEIDRLNNDKNYYQTHVDNSRFIASFYNRDVLLKEWDNYYHRIYQKYKK